MSDGRVTIVGGGIAGFALALGLHARGVACEVLEAAPEIRALGVGITLLPHAVRELTDLGLGDDLAARAIETRESRFFNRFGQLLYREDRGRYAGYEVPELGIHRARLHSLLLETVQTRLGLEAVALDRRCTGLEQDDDGVTIGLCETSTGRRLPPVRTPVAIGCDGIHSVIRSSFYPDDPVAFTGINTWRGVSRHEPILGGRTYMRIGALRTGKLVVYPIQDDVDADGRQLINWNAEIARETDERNDWNTPGDLADFLPLYADWRFDWLDVPELLGKAETILEYPMVDKDPLPRWTFGRVTLAGDAAHPMYPRGSNGVAQALIDVRTLAALLADADDPRDGLRAYEDARLEATSRVVRANRETPPDIINTRVEELTGDRPFGDLGQFVSQAELRELSDRYKAIAGFALNKEETR